MKKLSIDSEIFTRAVEEIIIKEHLEKVLRSGKKLRVKFGIDPTSPDLHLGHTVPLRKLREFQQAGHVIILIIGDFTATVGDPSGRSETRAPLARREIQFNMKHYLTQAGKILDLKKTEVRYNSEWYKKAGVAFLYELMSKVTVQRVMERDDFKKRMRQEQDINMLEFIYPILQGYDSVAVRADLEIGGSDQKFNLLMGRKIQRRFNKPEQDILTTWLIEGTDGARKMSKSMGNYIGLTESPEAMFGKIMTVPDGLIVKYFFALTDVSSQEIKATKKAMRAGELNPRDAKMLLGEKIVATYYNKDIARAAREQFFKTFSQKENPATMPALKIPYGPTDPVELLLKTGFVFSKSAAGRLLRAGAVDIDGRALDDSGAKVEVKPGMVIRVGKRKFARVA